MSQRDKPRLALNNITAGVREREDANRTREAGHLDEIQGVVANTLKLLRNWAVGFIDWLDVVDRHRFDPLCAPSRGVEWVGKVLGFMRHFSFPTLHNAHGVDALALVDNHVLGDPEIAFSHDPADRKPRWPTRMMTTKRLQVTPTANYLA